MSFPASGVHENRVRERDHQGEGSLSSSEWIRPYREPALPGFRAFWYYLVREVSRFWAVRVQTLLSPVLNLLMFVILIASAVGGRSVPPARLEELGISFTQFAAAGLLMMSVIQNSYMNTSSSLSIMRVNGTIFTVLASPISSFQIVLACVLGAAMRVVGICVIAGVVLTGLFDMPLNNPLLAMIVAVLSAVIGGSLGCISALYSQRFEQQAFITSFIITPLALFSGTFFTLDRLPSWAGGIMQLNPFFYMVDLFRYMMVGYHEVSLLVAWLTLIAFALILLILAWWLFSIGWRIKS